MHTFLPFPDYALSVATLDRDTLSQQRVECLRILKALDRRSGISTWNDEPVVRMWQGYPVGLIRYTEAVIARWVSFGFVDGNAEKLDDYLWRGQFVEVGDIGAANPPWLGDAEFHLSHQSNLKRINPEFYDNRFPPDVPANLPYQWPLSLMSGGYVLIRVKEVQDGGKG
jgi:hypothetical protein